VVSLNSIMVDGTGMCGGCRVIVEGKSQFACVDGPEFDAHKVDFDVLTYRNRSYLTQEQEALRRYEAALADTKRQAPRDDQPKAGSR
jgi:ferredoxin--NADP+ reductase